MNDSWDRFGKESDEEAMHEDDVFEATQTGPATQPQSLPTGPQDSQLDHWGKLIPLNQASNAPIIMSYAKRVYKLGRNHACDIVFAKEARVSNTHLVFSLNDTDPSGPVVMIEDMKSSNGTYVNGKKLEPRKRRVLRHGDDISIGQKPLSLDQPSSGSVRLMFISAQEETVVKSEVHEKYHITNKIGSGTFAEVKRAMCVATGEIFAVKEIDKHKHKANAKTMLLFEREIEILGTLKHDNVCQLNEVFEDDNTIYLILEFVDGGNVLEHIMQTPGEGGLPEEEARNLTFQICTGMAYCHRQNVTHRDLKPENVLITKGDKPRVKIADFGLAKMINHSGTILQSMVGTPQYLAPEVVLHLKGEGYDQAVDSWSVGIMVYAMLTKLLPFSENEEDTVEVRLKKRRQEVVDFSPFDELGISALAKDFVGRLLCVDPTSRLSLEAALNHPWLRPPPNGVPSALDTSISLVSGTNGVTTAVGTESSRDFSRHPSGMEDEYSQPFSQLQLKMSNGQGGDTTVEPLAQDSNCQDAAVSQPFAFDTSSSLSSAPSLPSQSSQLQDDPSDAPPSNPVLATPARSTAKAEGDAQSVPRTTDTATSTLRRSTRRKTISPIRAHQLADEDADEHEPSPAKRLRTR